MDYILEYIEKEFSEHIKKHTFGVCETAKSLANLYNADEEKAVTAALFHDLFKEITPFELQTYASRFNLEEKYKNNINLAHSKIAAEIMTHEYDISDIDIINAVKFHTTGRANMSLLEKILYIADVIEPGRSYPGVEEIRELAYVDLDKACLAAMENTVEHLRKKGVVIDEDTIQAIEWLRKENENGK